MKHPKETITLLTCAKTSPNDLNRLVENAVMLGRYAGTHCTVNVSEDGKSLLLTSPSKVGFSVIVK